jgi:MerR HTH family regulatory protein
MGEGIWTLDELTERVGAALSVGYHGQPSGRVRDLPDRRAIRWYTTIGIVDRPAAMRGRTALYGPRHLLQLVAIKRLQARGLPLVAIQAQLAGATDAQLARLAQAPGEDLAAPVPPSRQPAARDGLATTHAAPPAPVVGPVATPPPAPAPPTDPASDAAGPPATPAAPAAPPARTVPATPTAPEASPVPTAPGAPATPTAPGGAAAPAGPEAPAAADGPAAPVPAAAPARPRGPDGGGARPVRAARFWRERPVEAGAAPAISATPGAPRAADLPGADGGEALATTLRGVRLGEGATLLLEPAGPLDAADLRAILDAARPLIETLRARGLGGNRPKGHRPGGHDPGREHR